MDMKLEVLVVPVTDVDRAKRFYQKLGFRLDIDYAANEDYRIIQFTPPGSEARSSSARGSPPLSRARSTAWSWRCTTSRRPATSLLSHGVEVSEVFHDAGGGLGGGFHAGIEARAPGPDPQRRSYASYASFSDPDGNVWLLQEIKERLPGRV